MNKNFVITEITRVVLVGKNEYPEQMTSFSHMLPHNELIFHFSGHTTVYFDDQILETLPNTIRFLPKGNANRYSVLRHEHGKCILVCFQADRQIESKAFVTNVIQADKVKGLFKKIFTTWVSKNNGYYFECISLLYRIFAELQKNNYTPKQHELKIAPALEMIYNDFLKTNLSLKDLSSTCNMGESYFQKLFKEKYGVSPKRYIVQLKINHACDLLLLERYSITEIAAMCNFSDVYFFSRQFKEYMGITPTQFIKKYKSSK